MHSLPREIQLFRRKNIKKILAIDEVGRGALAGPLVVGGLLLDRSTLRFLKQLGIKDSKKLTPLQRQHLFNQIKKAKLPFTLIKTTNKRIDRLGIGRAWRQSVYKLISLSEADFILIDGNTPLPFSNYESWVKGDERLISIGAISIIAKVQRDRFMNKLAKRFPVYGFDKHKGYGTKYHRLTLKKFGPCPYHRLSFCHHFLKPK